MTITNLTTLFLVLLDVDEMKYSSWMYFFKNLYRFHELLKYILGEQTNEASSSDSTPPTMEWSHSIALKAKLRSMKLGDLSIDAYFHNIESIDNILTSIRSPISNDDVVTNSLE
ncbi:hypothetical protein Tco_0537806 [Tanacetum coccineum]